MAIALLMLFIGIVLFALPEVQPSIRATTFNHLFTIALIVLVIAAFLRPAQHLVWLDHLSLAIVTATYALLLSNLGTQALHQLLLISMYDAMVINIAFFLLLCIMTIIQFIQCNFQFIRWISQWGNHLQFFTIALIATILQLAYGLQEMLHLPIFPFPNQQIINQYPNLVTFNVILASIPVMIAVFRLFLVSDSPYLSRFFLLLLGLICAALQNFLGTAIQFPLLKSNIHLLSTSLASFMHADQLAAYCLILIAYILISQWQSPFGWFDRFSLLFAVTVCAFLQSTVWTNYDVLQRSHGISIQLSQLYLIVINKLIAQALMFIALVIPVIAISRIFLHLFNDFNWFDRQTTRVHQHFIWLDQITLPLTHVLLLITNITNMLLLWLHSSSILQVMVILPMTRSQLIIITLLLSSLVTLIRMSQPLSSIDRWLILINVITCALLLFTGYMQQASMSDHTHIMSAKPWTADLHIVFSIQIAAFGLVFAALVSLMWVRRRIPPVYRSMLKIGFGLTLICTLLQWLSPGLLIVSLITLTLSVMIATQVEQI